MRLNRKVLAVLIIGAFVIAISMIFVNYVSAVGDQRALQDRLDLARVRLPPLTAEKEELQRQRVAARSALESSMTCFPRVVESIEYGEDLYRVAYGEDLCRMAAVLSLDLTSLTAGSPAARTDGGISYHVATFSISIRAKEGDPEEQVRNILRYIDAIATGVDYRPTWIFQEPWSVQINEVSISGASSATISIDIYSYGR